MCQKACLTAVVGLAAAAVVASPLPVAAQTPVVKLSQAESTFPEPFGLVGGVREMPDGRVIIADPLGQALILGDLRAGRADTLGGVGQGPGEYRQPDALFALPGDSTLLVDLGNARLTTLAPDGSFGPTMPLTRGDPGAGGLLIVLPRGVDARGRLYFQPMGGGRPGLALPDSGAVVRFDRASGVVDTIAAVKLPGIRRITSGGGDNVMMRPQPLTPEDAWAVAPDGRVAVARSADYHVEWVQPDGRVVRGAPVSYRPVAVGRADKEEWVEGLGNGISISVMIADGEQRISMGRGGAGQSPDIDSFEWPEVKPPFTSRGLHVTPGGDLWVQRSVPAGAPRVFDVFGADAQLKGKVELPPGRTIAGFGRDRLYAVRTDDMGLQWLEVYRLRAVSSPS
jgi:hypothetical protein